MLKAAAARNSFDQTLWISSQTSDHETIWWALQQGSPKERALSTV
jgi:hypothetical protein